MKVLKGYKFRIYPDEKQKKFFIETFGCVRLVYNYLLMARQQGSDLGEPNQLTPAALKKEYPFLKQTDSLALANAQRNLDRAFKNYFNGRAGYPKLKTKKNDWQSYTTNNQKHTIYLEEDQLKLPKLKSLVSVHLHRPIMGNIKSATISAYRNQEFYVSILCLEEVEALPKSNASVGIAYCPQNLVKISVSFTLPKMDQENLEQQLQREQRKLQLRAKIAKKRKILLINAKNYQKQKQRVLKLRLAKTHQKRDFIDQLTIRLVRHFDYLFIEAQPKFDADSSVFSESDWQHFLQRIKYKSQWYGKELHTIEVSDKIIEKCLEIERQGRKRL